MVKAMKPWSSKAVRAKEKEEKDMHDGPTNFLAAVHVISSLSLPSYPPEWMAGQLPPHSQKPFSVTNQCST
jgi:hypothetical protein